MASSNFPESRAETSQSQTGSTSVGRRLIARGLPLTRSNWFLYNGEAEPDPGTYPAELEVMLPEWARENPDEEDEEE